MSSSSMFSPDFFGSLLPDPPREYLIAADHGAGGNTHTFTLCRRGGNPRIIATVYTVEHDALTMTVHFRRYSGNARDRRRERRKVERLLASLQ